MRPQETSTARTRELGYELQRVRKRAGYTATDMARMLGWPLSNISRLESGKRETLPGNVAIYLARARATPEELEDIVALASEPHGYQLQFHSPGLPDRLRTLTLLEAHSTAISTYSPDFIPALLQTEPYIRAVLQRHGHSTGPDLEAAVEARLDRYAVFTQDRFPTLTFYLHENALNTMVGDPTVMYEQLLQLQMASSLPHCHLHVVPTSAEVSDSGREFSIFQHEEDQPVLHIDALTASLFLETDTALTFYQDFLHHLATTALDRDQSREWIVNRTSELEQTRPAGPAEPAPEERT